MHHFDELAAHIPNFKSRRMLDAGSGRGKTLIEAARRGYAMRGLEISREYIEMTLARAREERVDIDVQQGVLERTPFTDQSFDFINCAEVIEHVEDPDAVLHELYRILSVDGYCYLSVPSRFGIRDPHYHLYFINWLPRSLAQRLLTILGRQKTDHGAGKQGLDTMYYDTWRGARHRAERAGFVVEDIRMRKVGGFWRVPYRLLRSCSYATHHLLLRKPRQRVLIVHTGKLGDAICATPVFRALKEAWPEAEISLATTGPNREVLKGNPHISRFLDVWSITPGQCHDITTALLLNPNPELLRILLRARVPRILTSVVVGGYSPFMTLYYRLLSLFATRVPHRMGHYAPSEYLALLHPLGIVATDTTKELTVDTKVQDTIDARLARFAGHTVVAIAPGAGNKIKEWPAERFNEVAKYLIDTRNAVVVVVGSKADQSLGAVVVQGLPKGNVWDTTGLLNIEELKALIKRVDVFVSADTGPIYIAEAHGVPTIDIVGPMDEREQPPRGSKNIVIVPKRERPMLHIMNARMYDAVEARRQVESITSQEVIAAVDSILNEENSL